MVEHRKIKSGIQLL